MLSNDVSTHRAPLDVGCSISVRLCLHCLSVVAKPCGLAWQPHTVDAAAKAALALPTIYGGVPHTDFNPAMNSFIVRK